MAIRWLGGAQAYKDLWTIALSGTLTSQTYTVTIGLKTITYVADGSATAAIILLGLYNAWVSTASPVPQEFRELVPTLDNTTTPTQLFLTGTAFGVPHPLTLTSSGAATISCVNTTPATGPNHADNANNWSDGVGLVNSATGICDSGSVPIKYGFATLTALTGVTIRWEEGYAGQIGLPDRNTDATPYQEYRTSSLTLTGGTLIVNSSNATLCRVNFQTTVATVRVLNSGSGLNGAPAVLVTGGATSSEVDLTKGSLGLAYFGTETANFPVGKQSYLANQNSDSTLILGTGCSMTTLTKSGGITQVNCALTTFTQSANGGSVVFLAGAIGTLNASGGAVDYRSNSTITTLNIHNDAQVTADSDPRSLTITNAVTMTGKQCSFRDNQKRINSGVLTLTMTDATLDQVQHGTSNSVSVT